MPVWPGYDVNNFVLDHRLYFVDYNDTSTASSPINLVADTWTDVPNDGLGAFSNTNYLPADVSGHLDSNGYIDLTELPIGSSMFVRPDFTVTPSVNNAALAFRFSLGTGAGSYTLESDSGRLDLGAGIPYRRALDAKYIYLGDSNTRDNPVKLQVKLSSAGTLVNAGMVLEVRR